MATGNSPENSRWTDKTGKPQSRKDAKTDAKNSKSKFSHCHCLEFSSILCVRLCVFATLRFLEFESQKCRYSVRRIRYSMCAGTSLRAPGLASESDGKSRSRNPSACGGLITRVPASR